MEFGFLLSKFYTDTICYIYKDSKEIVIVIKVRTGHKVDRGNEGYWTKEHNTIGKTKSGANMARW